MSATAEPTEHHSLAEACKRVPHGVVCLLSALRFHGLTTQLPYEIWMAIPGTTRRPNVRRPALRFHRFSGLAMTDGIEAHSIEGVQVKVYHPAKTVADCFKFRNKIGLEHAPALLAEIVDSLRTFLVFPLNAASSSAPYKKSWKAGGPWS